MMQPKIISSRDNPTFKNLIELLQSKGIKKQKKYLLFGDKITSEALGKASKHRLLMQITTADGKRLHTDLPELQLSGPLFKELDVFNTQSAILLAEQTELVAWRPEAAPAGLSLFLALSDPSNLGAALRLAAAFAAKEIVLLQESASAFHPKAIRASSGLNLIVPLKRGPSIQDLPQNTSFFALDAGGFSLHSFRWPQSQSKTFLLLGEEGRGIPSHLDIEKISIPMQNDVESLNASTALAISLWARNQYLYRTTSVE